MLPQHKHNMKDNQKTFSQACPWDIGIEAIAWVGTGWVRYTDTLHNLAYK